jgi:hypothetical protein
LHTPGPDGRIAITSAAGIVRFTKNGTSVRASMDSLPRVVADDPAAAEQAREATSDFRDDQLVPELVPDLARREQMRR